MTKRKCKREAWNYKKNQEISVPSETEAHINNIKKKVLRIFSAIYKSRIRKELVCNGWGQEHESSRWQREDNSGPVSILLLHISINIMILHPFGWSLHCSEMSHCHCFVVINTLSLYGSVFTDFWLVEMYGYIIISVGFSIFGVHFFRSFTDKGQ